MKTLPLLCLIAAVAAGCSSAPESSAVAAPAAPAAEAPAPKPGESRKVLSVHATDAEFLGVVKRPCMHRTALCPDRCDHGGSVAEFKILAYRSYEKTGEYGDPRATKFFVRVRDARGNPVADAALLRDIEALKAGDKVRLDWRHEYVTRGGSSFPERPVTTLKPESK